MTTRVIRYRTRSERTDENEKLVSAVYAELAERRPSGIRYLTVRLPDGAFIHVFDDPSGISTALTDLGSFQAFQAEVGDRCEPGEQPVAVEATVVGAYGWGEP